MTQGEFAQKMLAQIEAIRSSVQENYYFLNPEQLNLLPANGGWSMLQCFEHINLANGIYIERLREAMTKPGQKDFSEGKYSMGLIGKSLVNSQMPKDGRIRRKSKTFDILVPLGVKDKKHKLIERIVFEKFNQDLDALAEISHNSHGLNWKRTKINTLAGKWIRIQFGDAIALALAHTERHVEQADKIRRSL